MLFYKHSETMNHFVLFECCVSLFARDHILTDHHPLTINSYRTYVDNVTQKQIDHTGSSNRCTCTYIKKIRAIYYIVYGGGQLWSVLNCAHQKSEARYQTQSFKNCIYHCMLMNMSLYLNRR